MHEMEMRNYIIDYMNKIAKLKNESNFFDLIKFFTVQLLGQLV